MQMFERPEGAINLSDLDKMKLKLDAIEFAKKTRERLNIDPEFAIDIFSLLESVGILVLQILDLGASGFIRVIGREKAVFINGSDSLGRQRYTAAHEFCHILKDLDLMKRLKEMSEEEKALEHKKMEYFAFKFADHFLMTEESLFKCLDSLGIHNFSEMTVHDAIRIQHHFGLSYRQVIRMLNKYQVISDQQHEEFKLISTKEDPNRLIEETERAGFPVDLSLGIKESRIPNRFLTCVTDNIKEGRMTQRKALFLADLLKMPSLKNSIMEVGHSE